VLAHLRRNAIAYTALFFALAGTSFAAGTKLLPANSVGTRQVIDHSLRAVDFRRGSLPPGRRGATGPRGFPGPQGADGPQGPAGPPSTVRAYAHVGSAGTLDAARSQNVTVTNPATGLYCLKPAVGIDPATAIVNATPDYSDSPVGAIVYGDHSTVTACGTGLVVRTFKTGITSGHITMTPQNMGFYAIVP
jgi:hypothetical protein